jgi:hypothetical protein
MGSEIRVCKEIRNRFKMLFILFSLIGLDLDMEVGP